MTRPTFDPTRIAAEYLALTIARRNAGTAKADADYLSALTGLPTEDTYALSRCRDLSAITARRAALNGLTGWGAR